jgi:hypothetical protein
VVKKSAIEARQGHPTGIIDDAAKAVGQAVKYYAVPRTAAKVRRASGSVKMQYYKGMKATSPARNKVRKAGEFVSDVASDRYARTRYSTLPKAKDNVKAKVAARKQQKNWMMPDGELMPKRKAKKAMKKYGPK